MKKYLVVLFLAALVFTGCEKAGPREEAFDPEAVIFYGSLLDKSAYFEKAGHIYIEEKAIEEKSPWVRLEDDEAIAYRTTDERIIQIPLASEMAMGKEGERFVDMTALSASEKMTTHRDRARKLAIFGTFDREDLAYSDITDRAKVAGLSITWAWPEEGIDHVEVVEAKESVAFIFEPTGEALGSIERNPENFPAKNQYLLAVDDEGYLVAEVAEKDPREQGMPPRERDRAIDGILSLLTSVKDAE